jgi:hypothetical protein
MEILAKNGKGSLAYRDGRDLFDSWLKSNYKLNEALVSCNPNSINVVSRGFIWRRTKVFESYIYHSF